MVRPRHHPPRRIAEFKLIPLGLAINGQLNHDRAVPRSLPFAELGPVARFRRNDFPPNSSRAAPGFRHRPRKNQIMSHATHTPPPGDDRRSFMTKATAVVIGGFVGLVPLGAGLFTLLDPIFRKSRDSATLKIATLD